MKIFLVKRSYFTFRGTESCDLDILGKTAVELMCENLGAELCEMPPAGEKVVLFPAFPFLKREQLEAYLQAHAGSVRFAGGYAEREGEPTEAEGFGDGLFTLQDYAAVLRRAACERAEFHLKNGALVEEGAEVGYRVLLGRGAIVRSGARISGDSVIGENAEIGGGSVITNSSVGAGTVVRSSVLDCARVGKNCTVGPNAYLRPASAVGNGCRIGDFVEIKNANIADGCKISHLAYVGDADLGERVNVGCGAVFVNFDGRRKHRTSVGNGCFIGSNCNLVAPVRLGDGAFLAAGTTLTRDLSAGDFCIGRSLETVKADGAKKYLP